MSEAILNRIRDLIQEDPGGRGLRTEPENNLVTACASDFLGACRSLAETLNPAVAIVTGFFIPHAQPPAAETDGPLGALFLARALVERGIRVVLATDSFCERALEAGIGASGLRKAVPLVILPPHHRAGSLSLTDYWQMFAERTGALTHLIALERVGPSHTEESIRAQAGKSEAVLEQFLAEVPADHHDRCHTMRGRDITTNMSPAHRLFEVASKQVPRVKTVAIGDGGNEIGMGKIPWLTIRRNIPGGGLVACRVPADFLIVAGVSNWGAYGLAAGLALLKGQPLGPGMLDAQRERALLSLMVEVGPLVDGISGKPEVSVDGLAFDRYAEPLRQLAGLN